MTFYARSVVYGNPKSSKTIKRQILRLQKIIKNICPSYIILSLPNLGANSLDPVEAAND